MKLPGKLRRFLVESYTVLAVAASILLIGFTVWAHSAAIAKQWIRASVAALLVIGVAIADHLLKKLHDKEQGRIIYENIVAELLRAAALSVLQVAQPKLQHIRTNIMIPDEEQKRLLIRFHYGFVPEDQDKNIVVTVGTGCAGQAWLQGTLICGDLTQQPPAGMGRHWGMPAVEAQKVRPSLRCVLSIPIVSPSSKERIGLLNFDSDNTMSEMKFDDKAALQIAYCFADAVGLILDRVL